MIIIPLLKIQNRINILNLIYNYSQFITFSCIFFRFFNLPNKITEKDYSIEILSITHQHNDNVTYEIHLCGEDFEKMLPVVKFLSKNYKLVDDKKINHPGRFVLSVL